MAHVYRERSVRAASGHPATQTSTIPTGWGQLDRPGVWSPKHADAFVVRAVVSALLRLRIPAVGAVLRIATGGLRGAAPLQYLQGIYAAGLRVPAEHVKADERWVEARLEPEIARAAAADGLVLVCRPLLPYRAGSSDRRRLGMPIFRLELGPLELSASCALAARPPAPSTALA